MTRFVCFHGLPPFTSTKGYICSATERVTDVGFSGEKVDLQRRSCELRRARPGICMRGACRPAGGSVGP